jgi:hypothetical protein
MTRRILWPEIIGRPAIIAIVVLLTLSFSADTGHAQVYDAYSTADSITVGDRFKIVVSVAHDGSADVVFPHLFIPDSLRTGSGWSLGDFIFLDASDPMRRDVSDSWVVDSVLYEVTTFALDTAFVELLPVGLISATDTLVAATPSIIVPVTSLVPEDAEGLRDITDLAEFPASGWFWWALLFLILAGWAFWYWKRRNQPEDEEDPDAVPEPEEPPWDEAQERLKRLEETDLSDPELVKPFYVELSEILRTYLERRTKVPALESSTSELIEKLENAVRDGLVPAEMVAEIKQVLAQADLVKFARMQPPSSVGENAIAHARTAIDETEKEMISYESRLAAIQAEAKARADAEATEIAELAEREERDVANAESPGTDSVTMNIVESTEELVDPAPESSSIEGARVAPETSPDSVSVDSSEYKPRT